jgi:hypothetical protein
MTDEACVMSSEVLSALITLFAQGLNTEIVRYERLDEITPENLSPSPYPYIEMGMVMIRKKGAPG